LSSGYSKKLDNHVAAVALYVSHYNLCRPHVTLSTKGRPPMTPAMALGLTDHPWSIAELIVAAEHVGDEPEGSPPAPSPVPPQPRFTVIQGGQL
jgi:hypothetical protein